MQLSLFTVLVLIASFWSVAAVPAAKVSTAIHFITAHVKLTTVLQPDAELEVTQLELAG